MKSMLLESGKRLLAKMIGGDTSIKLNGQYITFGPAPYTSVQQPSLPYFESLADIAKSGYARIPVTSTGIRDGKTLIFTGMLTFQDLIGYPVENDSVLTTATLAWMPDEKPVNDVFVYTTIMKTAVSVTKNCYMTVNVGMSIGE